MESRDKYDPIFCLSWGDVAVDSRSAPTMVKVHLKRSKCDQFGIVSAIPDAPSLRPASDAVATP